MRPHQTWPIDRSWGAGRAAQLTQCDTCFLPQRAAHISVSGMRTVPSTRDVYHLHTVALHARAPVLQRARTIMCVPRVLVLWCQCSNITCRSTLNTDLFAYPTFEWDGLIFSSQIFPAWKKVTCTAPNTDTAASANTTVNYFPARFFVWHVFFFTDENKWPTLNTRFIISKELLFTYESSTQPVRTSTWNH